MLTNSFAGIAPASVAPFVAAQLLGGLAAAGLARFLHPQLDVHDLVVAHDDPDPRSDPHA